MVTVVLIGFTIDLNSAIKLLTARMVFGDRSGVGEEFRLISNYIT